MKAEINLLLKDNRSVAFAGQNSRNIRDIQAQKFLHDLKTLSFSCLASLYLLCSA